MLPVRVTNHVAQGLSLLIAQYQNKPLIAAWLTAALNRVQELENATYDVIVYRWLGFAVGVQLDTLGKIVLEPRLARGDDDDGNYRYYIGVRVRINRSQGGAQDVFDVLNMITTTTMDVVREEYPAFFFLEFADPPTMAQGWSSPPVSAPVQILTYLSDAKLAGVGIYMIVPTTDDSHRFLPRDIAAPDNVNVGNGCGDALFPYAPPLPPSLLVLTGFWEASWTGGGSGLWTSRASLGPSAGATFTAPGGHVPTNGTAVNSLVPPHFDGGTQFLETTAGEWANLFTSPRGWTIAVLFNADAASSDTGNPEANVMLAADDGILVGISFTSLGVQAFQYDVTETYQQTPYIAAATGTPILVIARYDHFAGLLKVRVGNVESSIACGDISPTIFPLNKFCLASNNPSSLSWYQGTIDFVLTAPEALEDSELVAFAQSLETTFAFSPGTLVTAPDADGLLSDAVTIRNPLGPPYVRPPSAPTIQSILPVSGPTTGGTAVTVTGIDFDYTSAVRLDPFAVATPSNVDAIVIVSNDELTFVTPPYVSGPLTLNLLITTPRGTGFLAAAFTYTPPPYFHIDSISPNNGTFAGGTAFTISGQDFIDTGSPVVAVNFVRTNGDLYAVPFTLISDTTIDCTSPATGILGDYGRAVQLILANGTTYTTAAGEWTYDPGPSLIVSSIVPPNGSMIGGYTTELIGSGFVLAGSGVYQVAMNLATVGSIVVIDDNHLTFVMPNKTGDYAGPGPWTDTVVAEIATPPTNVGIPFTFDAFAIQTISPDHTAAAGGATITLSGTGLDETTILYVDGSSTAFTIVDQHTVTFVAPAHAAGTVVVDLTGSVSPDTMINLTYV